MDKKKFYKRVLVLAVPIALQNLLTALLNIFDQMMVGWLPGELPGTGLSVADTGLSAVLLANQIVFIYQIVIFAVCNTVNIFIAQYTENGNEKLIKNRAGFTFVVIAAVALIFTFVCYFGAEGVIGLFNPGEAYRQQAVDFLRLVSVSFVPMGLSVGIVFMLRALKRLGAALVVNVCACGLNFLLNYTFMFGLFGFQPIGLLGAAYGTIVSRAVECVAMIAVLFLLKNPLVGRPKEMFRFDAKFAGQYVKMFFPILCNEIFWVLATTVYLFVYDKLEDSEVVLASVNIAQSLDKIVSVVMIGAGSAVGVIIGNVIGKGNRAEIMAFAAEATRFSLMTGAAVALLTVGAAFVAPLVFVNASAATHSTARNLILLYAVTAIPRTLGFTQVIGILRSGGDTTFCMVAETITVWAISVPLAMICGLLLHANVYVVYLMSNVCELIKNVVFGLRVRSGKWIRFGASEAREALAAAEEDGAVLVDTSAASEAFDGEESDRPVKEEE